MGITSCSSGSSQSEEGSYQRPEPSWLKRLCPSESENEARLPMPEQTAACWLDRLQGSPVPLLTHPCQR